MGCKCNMGHKHVVSVDATSAREGTHDKSLITFVAKFRNFGSVSEWYCLIFLGSYVGSDGGLS